MWTVNFHLEKYFSDLKWDEMRKNFPFRRDEMRMIYRNGAKIAEEAMRIGNKWGNFEILLIDMKVVEGRIRRMEKHIGKILQVKKRDENSI